MPAGLDVDKIWWKTNSSFQQDGLEELIGGAIAIPASVILMLMRRSGYYAFLLAAFGIVVVPLAIITLKYLRKRLHTPRCGYAEIKVMPRKARRYFLLINLGALFGVYLVGVFLGVADPVRELMPVWLSVYSAGAFGYHYLKSGSKYCLLSAAVFLASGAVAVATGHGWLQKMEYFAFITGVLALAAGSVRLRLFLRNHPKVSAEMTDGD